MDSAEALGKLKYFIIIFKLYLNVMEFTFVSIRKLGGKFRQIPTIDLTPFRNPHEWGWRDGSAAKGPE